MISYQKKMIDNLVHTARLSVGFTLKTLAQLPLLMLQYLISPSPSQEQIRSSLFGWKSKEKTEAECPVKVRSE